MCEVIRSQWQSEGVRVRGSAASMGGKMVLVHLQLIYLTEGFCARLILSHGQNCPGCSIRLKCGLE
jgi:hypothetical protein